MSQLFLETIESWDDWGRVFQSIPAFEPLVWEICRREGLSCEKISNLTPGTNAVFRVDQCVIKIFAPKESGLDASLDCATELAVCELLTKEGIPSPRLLAHGVLADRYEFSYLITDYFPGQEAGGLLPAYSPVQKKAFAASLTALLRRLNRPVGDLLPAVDLVDRAVTNPRLKELPPALQKELTARARRVDLSAPVLVHGDLTGENLLIDNEGRTVVIDCADACLAPACYELPPIVFELFRCDSILLRTFAKETAAEHFAEQVLDGLCLHDFGASILREWAKREQRSLEAVTLAHLKAFLLSRLNEKD